MLLSTYYSQNYASIICQGLYTTPSEVFVIGRTSTWLAACSPFCHRETGKNATEIDVEQLRDLEADDFRLLNGFAVKTDFTTKTKLSSVRSHFHCLISDHLREHCPLSNCQWGFQAAKSSVSALLSTTHDWFQQIEDGKEIGAVFFDFCKAFDSVHHQPLLTKLCQRGIKPHIVQWIHNYLVDRKQCVVVNGASSLPTSVVSGVPQGSILGPLLFLIDIDDIADVSLSDGSKIVLYAVDILLYCPISLPVDLELLQRDVDTLENYASANYLTFNVAKCKFMLVSRKKRHINPNPSISLYGSPLEVTPIFKYLGLLITSDLSWTTHINNICSKARRILGLVYRRFYGHSDVATLRQLYVSLVRPHLEYAAPVLSPHLQKDIAMLEKTQQFASRICTKNWDAGYHELLDMLDLPSLAQRRLHTRLCYVYKIVHGLLYFPPDVVVPSSALSHNPRSHLLYQPFAHTNSYLHSFIPNSVSIANWNMLPDYVVSSPSFTSFKYNLSMFTL